MSTTSRDYETAIQIQDAYNLGGVLRAWGEMIDRIWEDVHEANTGTMDFRKHPINVLFASKVSDLTGCDDWSIFGEAYDRAKQASARCTVV
jgi:hypothetical protein